jgi:uncharacterized membrane protein
MATTRKSAVQSNVGYFYVWMSAAIALFAFAAFAPTYWLQLPAGTFVGTPLVHIHSAIFTAWTLFLVSQSYLAAKGRIRAHRAWGMAGIGLATAVFIMGTAVAIASLKYRMAIGPGDAARASFIVAITNMVLFGGFFIAAMVNAKRSETHRRLIFLATISLLPAAISRITYYMAKGSGPGMRPTLGPAPPVISQLMPHVLVVSVFIFAGIVYDWKTRGRPHSAWLVGAAVILTALIIRAPLSDTGLWKGFADASAHIAG